MRKHDFRMVLNKEQLAMIAKIGRLTGKDSPGKVIAFVIRFLIPLAKRKQFVMEEARNQYELFHWTDRIQVLMPEDDYQFVKLLHKSLNSFSMAWLIRQLLYFVFDYYDFYGARCFRVIKQLMKRVTKGNEAFRGCNKDRELPTGLLFRIDYDKRFKVIQVLSG